MEKILLAMLCACPFVGFAQSINGVIEKMRRVECYQATVDYQVLMSLQSDVNYTVALESQSSPTDTLAPCSYLISWRLSPDADSISGFCAYAGGDMYQFRGDRMQEYHYEQSPAVFGSSGSETAPLPGIQMRGQFANLLPQFIASEIAAVISDPHYQWKFTSDTVVGAGKCSLFEARMLIDGTVCKELTYGFDRTSCMPLFSEAENNPGALAEQTILCRYIYASEPATCTPITERRLSDTYPRVFDAFRESTFTINNLPSQPLPTIALPTTTGERYTHHRGDGFAHPTLVVLISACSEFAQATVADVRRGVSTLPDNVDVIWAFTDNNINDIETVVIRPEPGEHLLQSAKALARDCGASVMPVIIFVGTDGSVNNVIVGYNKNLANDVIEKAMNLK
ncbi:MAG: hypothetical protein NC343_00130 [Muribaculum sp.]|nr:hypothetical protein [Muribaculaceae bacterium]MCM1080143.1 hypothetical protein [Muribaculum sp.]